MGRPEELATPDTLDKGGRMLRRLGLTFRKTVHRPKQGDVLENIELQVPFTKGFVWEQRKKGIKRRGNMIITSKYNIWTFIPQATARQFLRYTNAFYLVIGILAIVGFYGDNLWIVSFDPVTIIILLAVVVGVALIFEGLDDVQRHQGDRMANNTRVTRIAPDAELEETTWGQLLPGDLVVVNNKESVPADMVLMASFGADKKGATCYIETSGIDGETNLKIKEAPAYFTNSLQGDHALAETVKSARSVVSARSSRFHNGFDMVEEEKKRLASFVQPAAEGTYEYEQPNVFLQFNGAFEAKRDPGTKHPIEFRNLLLRGSQLRNTKFAIGLVVYAGPETKLALSSRTPPAKFGRIDIFMNKILRIVTVLLLVMVILADLFLFVIAQDTAKLWYFAFTSSTDSFNVPGVVAYFFTFLILFSNIIPIPIIIVVEVMNFYAQYMCNNDLEMYHEETDTPAECRTGSLAAEIGQITHIFSDKTGTLTRNEMKMIGCWVDGQMYGFVPPHVDTHEDDHAPPAQEQGVSENGIDIVEDDGQDTSATAQPARAASPSGEGLALGNEHEVVQLDSDLIEGLVETTGPEAGDFDDLETGENGELPAAVRLATQNEQEKLGTEPPESSSFDASAAALTGSELDDGLGDSLGDIEENRKSRKSAAGSIQVAEVFEQVIQLLEDTDNDSAERQAVYDFFVLLAVCHTVVLDVDERGNACFNAESPDEEAFVKAAQVCGVRLTNTADGIIRVTTPSETVEYRVLGLNPFNSTRKRMSLVLHRVSDGTCLVMMKGADNKMLERMAPGQDDAIRQLDQALTQYSWNGLRTLVMGIRELESGEVRDWQAKYKAALVAPSTRRGAEIAAAAEDIEKDMRLVGASAIEDQLQLGVPQAIKTLRDAGIQVWVLTGDKVETAINIGLSSNLIDPKMLQLKLVSTDIDVLTGQLDEIVRVLSHLQLDCGELIANRYMADPMIKEGVDRWQERLLERTKKPCIDLIKRTKDKLHSFLLSSDVNTDIVANVALVVSGPALELLLKTQKGNPELEARLLFVARACKVVLACRVSPAQKSKIVEMVRKPADLKRLKRPPITLAIGDGANDVPMIQSAHVGVGISGHEGRQAVNSSDFSIAQFRFLVRLMLVHGRWNYRRQANVITYMVYSWLLYTFLLFSFLPVSNWSGQQIYFLTIYTSVFAYFANVCIVAHGWFDRDISAQSAIRNPWTYAIGVRSDDLNYRKLLTVTLRAVLHLFIIVGLVFISDRYVTLEELGSAVYLALVMILFQQQALSGTTYTAITMAIFVLMIGVFFLFMAVTTTPPIIFSQQTNADLIWTGVALAVTTETIVEATIRYVKKEFFPRPLDLLIEQDRGYFKGTKHTRHAHNDALRVLEEFGRLTTSPLTMGVGRIKNAVDGNHHKAAKSPSLETEPSAATPGEGVPRAADDLSQDAMAKKPSVFQRMKPAFDYDMSTLDNVKAKVLQRLPGNRGKGSPTGRQRQGSWDEQMDENQAAAFAAAATDRLDIPDFEMPDEDPAPIEDPAPPQGQRKRDGSASTITSEHEAR